MQSNDAGRPAYSSEDVLQDAAARFCAELGSQEVLTSEAIASMARAIGRASGVFDLAKELERDGWEVDDQMLERLLDADSHRVDAHRAAVAAWVARRRIRPLRNVGSVVSLLHRGARVEAEIVAIDRDHATYTVCAPSMGHVREGCGVHGIIVPYEQVHDLCPPPEVFDLEAEGAIA